MSSKPALVIVPGSWHHPYHYKNLTTSLNSLGYKTVVSVHVPSIGIYEPAESDPSYPPLSKYHKDLPRTLEGDSTAVRRTLEKLLDDPSIPTGPNAEDVDNAPAEGREVVMLCHSYGGFVTTHAVEEKYGVEARKKAGKKGGVKQIVLVGAYAPTSGATSQSNFERASQWNDMDNNELQMNMEDGTAIYSAKGSKHHLFNGDTDPEVDDLIAALRPFSFAAFQGECTNEAWRYIPGSYIVFNQDRTVPEKSIEFFLGEVREKQPGAFSKKYTLDTYHCPLTKSQAKPLAQLIDKVIQEA